jgi:uncharacterized protein YjlB
VPGLAADHGTRQLAQVLRVYVQHHNQHRPHRALGLGAPASPACLTVGEAETACTDVTCSAVWSTSTGGLHERISAPHAQHEDLQVLGGIAAGQQHEQLEGPAQHEVREFR